MGRSQNLFRALWRALSKEVKEQVGTDQFGNKYYYIPEYKNWRGQTIREKRIVEAANKREVDYEVGTIPAEWEAWIKRTRKTPPTMEDYLIVAYYNKHKGKVKLSFISRNEGPTLTLGLKIWGKIPGSYSERSERRRESPHKVVL
ncbi:PREDICTED: mimitin, mitochondrial isoform X2 [Hipposideros armiger]|uniref:Mimitin, mitochondrial isoform X2 n=1 Tax=Hipposideros armiger TaxID=186990 RepID=A0A8B7SY23_HIPAR|nr:PREDICTED: mimitin, mitochondrial isoform X2 [Hipposideros armiger]